LHKNPLKLITDVSHNLKWQIACQEKKEYQIKKQTKTFAQFFILVILIYINDLMIYTNTRIDYLHTIKNFLAKPLIPF